MPRTLRRRPPSNGAAPQKRRFKVSLVRIVNGKYVRTRVFTRAFSSEQAARFAARRKPGFSVSRVEED